MIKKAYADTSGGQCHYRYQSGASDPIVFLHQTPSSSQMFEAIMRRLQDYSTYAIDTPGFGQSFHPDHVPTMAEYSAWLVEAIQSIAIDRVHLFGHHTGSSMAIQIAQDPAADQVLSADPFALLVGMLLDQQYPMEHAFRGPAKILDRFGTLDPAAIATAEPDAFADLCATPPAIHRYGRSMAGRVQALAQVVVEEYDGDASRIWTDAKSGEALFARLTALPGYGEQKAKIFVALLAKQLDVKPRGWTTVSGDYSKKGYRSVADVVDADSLKKVRDFKKAAKAKAKAESGRS